MKPDYEEFLRQAEQKRLLTEIGQGADTMWSRIAGFQPNNAMYQQQYAAANDPIEDSLGIDNSQRQAERLDLERQQYGDAMQQQAADAAAQSARQAILDKRYEAEQLAKHGLEQDKLALEREKFQRLIARDKARRTGASGTMTKRGDIGLKITVPPREEFYGSDSEYKNLALLAGSPNAADRDRAFKLIDQSSDRQSKFTPAADKMQELETSEGIVNGLLSQTKGTKDAPPGLGGSLPERLVHTNTGYGILDRPAQMAGSMFLSPEAQANASDFQKQVNAHIKRISGSGVTASEADRVMKSFGSNVPWTDPIVRRKLLEAMKVDNANLRKHLEGNPFTRNKKGASFPVRVRSRKDGHMALAKNQQDLDMAINDPDDPAEVVQ